MILQRGDKLLVAHRRLFADDQPRYFVGTVDAYEDGVAEVTGYTWVRDPAEGGILAKPEPRTKILAIASGTLMVYKLPPPTDIAALKFLREGDGNLWLTDGKHLRLNLREHV